MNAPINSKLETPNPQLETAHAGPQLQVLPAPKAKPRARNGKIARLPYPERDMVNRMLRNNISYALIVGALDEHNIRVTEKNVSNWKTRGGYREWCAAQDHALEVRITQDNLTEYLRKHDAGEISEVGLQAAATRLTQFLLSPEAAQLLATDPVAYSRTATTLCRINTQIHSQQKYRDDTAKELGSDHNPERIKREIEKEIEVTRDVYSSEKIAESPREENIPHRNYQPKPT